MPCVDELICIVPPYAQIILELLFIIGPNFVITVGFAGSHVPTGTGMQGPGVKTPKAAAVKAAVIGFAKLLQTPNGIILRNGTKSMIVPIGPDGPNTIEVGRNTRGVGATPKGH